jgi:cytoskeletal protein CcmA (bactofilin family)
MRSFSLLAVAAGLAVAAAPGAAMEIRTGTRVVVGADEIIDDDLFAAGNSVDVLGKVTGDVIAFAQTITLEGPVGGSVNVAGQTVTINGPVAGTVRAAAQNVRVQGPVQRNVLGAGQSVDLDPGCQVGREAYLAGNSCRIAGPVQALNASVNNLVLEDGVAGDVVAYVRTLRMGTQAKVGGDLTYTSPTEASIPPDAVAGRVKHKLPERAAPRPRRFRPWGVLFLLVSGFVTGLVLVLAAPRASRSITGAPLERPGASLGWGALLFAATPVLAVIVCITIVGIPLAMISLAGWGIALYLGYIFAAIALGRALLAWALKQRPVSLLWCLLLGLVLLMLVKMIPYAGGLLILLGIVWGMGSMAIGLRRPPEPAPAAPVPPPPPPAQQQA